MRGIRALVVLLLLACGACRAAAPKSIWQPLPAGTPAQWRQLHLYFGPCAFVLASSEKAALQAHDEAAWASAACRDVLGEAPPLGLVIAVAFDDPLLVEDPQAMVAAIQRWNARATGREPPPAQGSSRNGDATEETVRALAARMIAGGISKDEPELALPAELQARIAHVVLLPTADCLERTCGAILDAALAKAGVSGWLVRMVADPKAMMVKELKQFGRATLLDVWLATEHVGPPRSTAVLERAGVAGVLPESSASAHSL